MKIKYTISVLLYSLMISFTANSFLLIRQAPQYLFLLIPAFLLINALAGFGVIKSNSKKLKICCHGTVLLAVFYISVILSAVYHIHLGFQMIPGNTMTFVWSAVLCVGVHFLLFWNGIICVYLTSGQLGIKLRLIGMICGMIPIVNLIVLFLIIRTTAEECFLESQKEMLNQERKAEKVCATRYPILMVHGVFFRDTKYFNYWGRIPKELENNGAKIFYGNQASAASIAECAAELKERIAQVLEETGAEKVNIIAHSKGGLDCRYAISKLGIGECVASLTTVNTPHKGCLFADYLLNVIDSRIQERVAAAYNTTLKGLGEANPDFLAAVNNLTDSYCKKLNDEMGTPEGIYCQSIGSVLRKAGSGTFPLNLSYHLVKHFDGENDGLVSANSFQWGENYILLRPKKKEGISHGDMIDLNRKNIRGFDVREFYVELVKDLKNKGL